eukprot:CAMPEP_0198492686 /NCGR_PEP_ID=MMETSP1462-20131121/3553_1 /TAXON_ID=1333877 /ORGANISM="Brandtodinium nutriculum, Strain RCC3387" /LENGTH=33 /DNA_ID= /DNA_START= /DNA_END= /DNA_ORIENTATION=
MAQKCSSRPSGPRQPLAQRPPPDAVEREALPLG